MTYGEWLRMPQPPNVRSKSPRQLGGDQGSFEPGLGHAGRWGLTSSTLAPSADDEPEIETSPTPPPVAVTLGPGAPIRRAPVLEPQLTDDLSLARRPTWKYWASAGVAVAALGLGLVLRSSPASELSEPSLAARLDASSTSNVTKPERAKPATQATARSSLTPSPAAPSVEIRRPHNDRHIPIAGGVLHLPRTFAPRDGGYDLVVHFHGDVKIVKESIEHAGVNAAVAIVNLGISSGPYESRYQDPTRFEHLLTQVQAGVEQRGFGKLELRRLALNAWSGGYGAIESILESRRAPDAENDPLDAILLFDGIHTSFADPSKTKVAERGILPFIRAAKSASEGRILFTLTHSQIDPIHYAGTEICANALLDGLGVSPEASIGSGPAPVKLKAASMSIGRSSKLEPTTDTRVGDFHVMGFRGVTPEAHAAHLLQMAAVGLPELAARWSMSARSHRRPIDHDSTSEWVLPSSRDRDNRRASATR